VGNKGGSDDDALAATINGLYKVELIHCGAHCEAHEAVELATRNGCPGLIITVCSNHRLYTAGGS
jgi:hypothetical protein